jgi:hypothetical protein
MSDMFHANWERRHGALTALRNIVRSHGGSAGKTINMTSDEVSVVSFLYVVKPRKILLTYLYEIVSCAVHSRLISQTARVLAVATVEALT